MISLLQICKEFARVCEILLPLHPCEWCSDAKDEFFFGDNAIMPPPDKYINKTFQGRVKFPIGGKSPQACFNMP